jgi:hypothetical protein
VVPNPSGHALAVALVANIRADEEK